jgi:hypothetical protein
MAARPFKRSAYSLKPNFGSSSLGVVVGCGCVIILSASVCTVKFNFSYTAAMKA